MRRQKRNQQNLYYALFVKKKPIADDYGNQSGEFDTIYSEPVDCKANISPAKGESESAVFGNAIDYDKVIIPKCTDVPIDESSVLWIDNLDTDKPHDYVVVRIAKSLNELVIAIKKVNVSI